MAQSYILKGTENEYLLVIRADDEKLVYDIIDNLLSAKRKDVQEIAVELEKSLHDNGRNSSKVGPKNKIKGTTSNNNKRRKTKDS
jgi:hypothetical protein